MQSSCSLEIKVGARGSKLSQAQVWEVAKHYPHVHFIPVWITTRGDRDKTTSLRTLDKTDFFTREVDELLLSGECRIAIHSAKDLPDPLQEGLELIGLTRGVDPADALVYNTLAEGAVIGTSSKRREENLLRWRPDFKCVDIRGTVDERLAMLDRGEIDGVVMAEAALIRLQIDRPRIRLQGETVPLQGKLAIIARANDREMQHLFKHVGEL